MNGSHGSSVSNVELTADSSHYWPAEPLIPDICLDWIWTESLKRGEAGSLHAASKVFLTRDMSGQMYLCYLMRETEILKCLKINLRVIPPPKDGGGVEEDLSERLVPGALTSLPCRDAAGFPDSDLILLVDTNNTLQLYTGLHKLCPVHINSSVLTSPYQKFDCTTSGDSNNMSYVMSSSRVNTPPDNTTSTLQEVSLSPVPDPSLTETPLASPSGLVSGLGPACSGRFVVEMLSGRRCLSRLPPLASSIWVGRCLELVCDVVPREKSLAVYQRWLLEGRTGWGGRRRERAVEEELEAFLGVLMDLMGFSRSSPVQDTPDSKRRNSWNESPISQPKKSKSDEEGTDNDWEGLLKSKHWVMKESAKSGALPPPEPIKSPWEGERKAWPVNKEAPLFLNSAGIFSVLHLLYEESKLHSEPDGILKAWAGCLYPIALSFGWKAYVDLYERDFTSLILREECWCVREEERRLLHAPKSFSAAHNPGIFSFVTEMIRSSAESDEGRMAPFLPVSSLTGDYALLPAVLLCAAVIGNRVRHPGDVDKLLGRNWAERFKFGEGVWRILGEEVHGRPEERLGDFLKACCIDIEKLTKLPVGLAVCFLDSAYRVRTGRDMVEGAREGGRVERPFLGPALARDKRKRANGLDALDKTRNTLLRLRFPKDERLKDVARMLDSSHPVPILVKQQPDQSDPDFREAQESQLYGLCLRTTSLPLGRGMATLRTSTTLFSQPVDIPELVLSGRAPNRNTKIEVPQKSFDWAHFNNGVAAALTTPGVEEERRLSCGAEWILNSLPKASHTGLSPHNAGYLFGLGLNGYLGRLKVFYVHEYLVKGDQLTSMALLLGIAVSKRGTMDLQVMKMLATHLPFLLPATLLELQIDPLIQTAGVMGVGLLYAETGHQGLAEALLKEMVKTPTTDIDPWPEREAYALSSGLAIGIVALGRGESFLRSRCSGSNLSLPDLLVVYMNGGPKQPWELNRMAAAEANQDGFGGGQTPGETGKGPSSHVREGDTINIHVTSPGATLALGLMFLKTGNKAISNVLAPPDSCGKLDEIRPDFLLLRTLSRNLICWEDVIPSREWVEDQLSDFLRKNLVRVTQDKDSGILIIPDGDRENQDPDSYHDMDPDDVDEESVCQAYANITTGACMAMALKFAGTCNRMALKTLIRYCRFYLPEQNKPQSVIKLLQKLGSGNIQTCLNTLVISLGVVMAGSGHLDVLRIVRLVRQAATVEAPDSQDLVYGTHVATHITLGLLFLGAGRCSLSTSNISVAGMVCAFYPRFPSLPGDNRPHPQILRHMYVLACEQRCLIPWDKESREMAYADITVKFTATRHHGWKDIKVRAPCVLPELSLLSEVRLEDGRYWSRGFIKGTPSWRELRDILRMGGWTDIYRRAGFFTHIQDPLVRLWRLGPGWTGRSTQILSSEEESTVERESQTGRVRLGRSEESGDKKSQRLETSEERRTDTTAQ